jgi:uncharacterized protein (TIGR03790 family)
VYRLFVSIISKLILLNLCFFLSVAYADDSPSLSKSGTQDQASRQNVTFNTTLFNAKQLALIVNDADQSSVNVAQYYKVKHQIPEENIIHVQLPVSKPRLTLAEFDALKTVINKQLLPTHLAVLFVWTAPYAVECYSITSAYTLGFDAKLCARTCDVSMKNPYFNQRTQNPLETFNMRLSMLLPSEVFEVATKVIDNGVLSQSGVFKSTAYFIKTSDTARNSRSPFFPKDGISIARTGLGVVNKQAEQLIDVHDIMIYHIGAVRVQGLETLNFLPGALADHLTSVGGDLYGNSQMTVLSWLKAGATASYGTVSEPCNYWQKFPNSSVLLQWYVSGNTAIEAYWKSVSWPAQGLFVGDPLSAPYAH